MIAVVMAAVALASCSSDSGEPGNGTDSGTTTTTVAPATTTTTSDRDFSIGIENFAFDTDPLVVSVGETVTWKNLTESTTHTSTSTDDLWASGAIAPGETFETTFDTPGTFTYFCSIHASMTGTIEVRES